jgi:6-phosphogluconate dehydrogenase
MAVHGACLAAYAQGLNIIDAANKNNHFDVDYAELLQIWRAGCIILADHMNNSLLMPLYKDRATNFVNPLYNDKVADELKRSCASLKRIVLAATEGDYIVPSLSAALEYLKYMTNIALQPSF